MSAKRGQLIVPKDSAVIGFPGEKASALNGNHLEIVKYSSKEDDNYIRLRGNILRIKNKIIAQSQVNQEEPTPD